MTQPEAEARTRASTLADELAAGLRNMGRLVAMLTYARRTTLKAVEGLTVAQLDHLHDPMSNSIGALLAHAAALEVACQCATFERRGLSDAERARWGAALELGARARREIRGHDLDHYRSLLDEVRARTLRELGERDDAWLEETTPGRGGRAVSNYFRWFHVLEDEISHRGQMRWLRQRLPNDARSST
ncbi:MAG: DUF664 domain-containing protein [Gemmatimonadaceae bacterium]